MDYNRGALIKLNSCLFHKTYKYAGKSGMNNSSPNPKQERYTLSLRSCISLNFNSLINFSVKNFDEYFLFV